MSKSIFLRAARDWTEDSIGIMVTPSLTAKAMLHYVQENGHYRSLSSYFTEWENLPSFLIVYTVSGNGYLRYKGKRHAIQQGQAFFIHCMDYQYYETDPENLWELLWVHFEGGTSRQYYRLSARFGFENVSHFINQFKKQEDATPISFRKTWQRPK
jgi:AraC-like DNA-binding protein